jgi:hypothetical protein
VSDQLHAPAALLVGRESPWMGPRSGVYYMEKRKFLHYRDSNSDASVAPVVVSRYTDCAISFPNSDQQLQIRLGAHMQFSVVQLFDRPIICYAHTVQLNDRSTVMSAHMQLNSCCNDKLC